MADDVMKYEDIRLEQTQNGFALEFMCVKKNPMAPESTYGENKSYKHEEMSFEITSESDFGQTFERATTEMKKLFEFNYKNKKSQDY